MGIRLHHLRSLALILVTIAGLAFLIINRTTTSISSLTPALNNDDMAAILKALTVAPITKHTATVIFVHGLGDSGHGWKQVAEILQDNKELEHIKWVLPHAPQKPVTANGGMVMPSWFDIYNFGFDASDIEKSEDEKGMLETAHSLGKLITEEVDAGIDASRIVLGGFSQGGAMTVLTGLSSERKLAGLAVLSGWTPMRNTLKAMLSDHAKNVPIFWGHGTDDPVVRYDVGRASADFLHKQGIPVASEIGLKGLSFNTYRGVAHSTNMNELVDLKNFIAKVVPPTS